MKAFHLRCTRVLSVLLSSTLLLSTSYAAPTQPKAQATQDVARARLHFERGVDLYDSGDVRAASIEFKRAYAIVPNYQLLFNIAQAQAELKDYVGALASLTQYLKDGGDEISDSRRSEVLTEIKRLNTYIAHFFFNVSVEGAQLWIDGIQVELPKKGGRVAVSVGLRRIELRHPDHLPWEKRVEVVGEDALTFDVQLVPRANQAPKTIELVAPEVRPVEPEGSQAPARKTQLGPLFWSGVGVTALFGTTSAILGGLALRAKGDHDEARKRVPTTLDAVERSANKVRALGLATDIGLILTVGSAAFTVSTFFWGPNKKRRAKEQRLNAALSPGGAWLSGRF